MIPSIKKIFNSSKYYVEFKKYSTGFTSSIAILVIANSLIHLYGIAVPVLAKNVIDSAVYYNLDNFTLYLSLFIINVVLTIITGMFMKYRTSVLTERMRNKLQYTFISNLYKTDWNEYSSYHSGDIMTRITRDINAIINFYTGILPSFIAFVLQLLIASYLVFKYDLSLALFALLFTPIVSVMGLLFGRKIKPLQAKINKYEGFYRSNISEMIHNLIIIVSFNHEKHSLKKLEELQEEKVSTVLNLTKTIIKVNTFIEFGFVISSFVILGWGAIKISEGIITFGTYLAISQLVSKIRYPLVQLGKLVPKYVSTLVSIDRCKSFMIDRPNKLEGHVQSKALGLKVQNVHFSYKSDSPLIEDISFDIAPKEKVAIIGASGVGKSTLMRLILGILTPNQGTITVYDTDSHLNTNHYYSYVPQGNTLFTGTISENLKIANEDAKEEEMIEALKHACAYEFINLLPNGLNSNIGERGLGLSEGQLQRICIARALLRNKPILLLDEATSALDQVTEEKVISNIYQHYPEKTMIAVTHRLSILGYVDTIINLEDVLISTDNVNTTKSIN